MGLDLVTVWMILLAFGIAVYVLLDGVHLGVGLLLPSARQQPDRHAMMNVLAPVCSGNVAWLVLCGVGFMLTFPLAFPILLEALSVPLLLMLLGFVLREIGFRYCFKTNQTTQATWTVLYTGGSLVATFCQGAIIGALLQGVAVEDYRYVGHTWDWLNWFSVSMGLSLLLAYALMGATWLLATVKAPLLYQKMRRYSHHLLVWLGYALTCLLLIIPFLTDALRDRWLGLPNFFYMGFVPMLALMTFVWAYYVIRFSEWRVWPISVVVLFYGTAYFTLITCLWPAVVPPSMNAYEAAAAAPSLTLALWGSVVTVPVVLGYIYRTYYSFYVKERSRNGCVAQ